MTTEEILAWIERKLDEAAQQLIEEALRERYSEDDDCFVHVCEEGEVEEDDDIIDQRIALIDRLRAEGKTEWEINWAVHLFDQANP